METAQYTDPLATEYITKTLIARRDRIGRTYFVKVLPLEEIRVVNERLEFKDLAVALGFVPPRDYDTTWFHLDNTRGVITPIARAATTAIPKELAAAPVGDYFATRVSMRGDPAKQVTVFLRKTDREIQCHCGLSTPPFCVRQSINVGHCGVLHSKARTASGANARPHPLKWI